MSRTDRTFSVDATRAALLAFALVLPLAVLEAMNQSITTRTLPLFGFLWLVPAVAVTGFLRISRWSKTPAGSPGARAGRLAGFVLVAFLVVVWVRLFVDQLPCFLGVPNCD